MMECDRGQADSVSSQWDVSGTMARLLYLCPGVLAGKFLLEKGLDHKAEVTSRQDGRKQSHSSNAGGKIWLGEGHIQTW